MRDWERGRDEGVGKSTECHCLSLAMKCKWCLCDMYWLLRKMLYGRN